MSHYSSIATCRFSHPSLLARELMPRRSLGGGGFTLLELLTVIAVIGLLAAMLFRPALLLLAGVGCFCGALAGLGWL